MLNKSYECVSSLGEPALPASHRKLALRRFAQENGWLPSYTVEYYRTQSLANGHIVVEHGMDTTAVISFLNRDKPFRYLNLYEQIHLLAISYNNLVDWHLFPDTEGLTAVFNRKDPAHVERFFLDQQPDIWRVDAFERISSKRLYPDLKSLDESLVEVLFFWKRALAGEMGELASNEAMSALFNSLIFVRAVEDQKRSRDMNTDRILINCWGELRRPKTILSCLRKCFRQLKTPFPKTLLDENRLRTFKSLSGETVLQLFNDFYKNRFIPYEYDFSLISKHALSKIYEHYVSLLQKEESPQLTFFPQMPKEVRNKKLGGFYTPQYIARFFGRYLKENLTPKVFRELKIADPACGSGIFLRTILEMQCEPWQEVDMRVPTEKAFGNILGIDIDENACHATRLSIVLLYLVLTESLPKELNVINSEAIKYFEDKSDELRNRYDAIIANPPYIAWADIEPTLQERIARFMGDLGVGRIDTYLGHLKLGLEMVKSGGFMLYVLPHSFLIAKNAQKMRQELAEKCVVRLVADLSEISVFENLGTYTILLIVQRKSAEIGIRNSDKATVVRCKEYPGHALQLAVEGKMASEDLYELYEVDQVTFLGDEWNLLPPHQMALKSKVGQLPVLSDFLEIKEGFITGCDDVFIRNLSEIAKAEREVYVPYLSDRNMEPYATPRKTSKVVFYPYQGNNKLSKATIQKRYPKTWAYIASHSEQLKKRKSVQTRNCEWWAPVRPRQPKNMLVPKIVGPHLMLLPKFSLDKTGKYAISHSPLMYPKELAGELDLLHFFLAVLNSSVVYWQISNLSHKYSRGYLMLEPKTLKKIRVPNPASIPPSTMKQIQSLVRRRIVSSATSGSLSSLERTLDNVIADIYGLTNEECIEIGLER